MFKIKETGDPKRSDWGLSSRSGAKKTRACAETYWSTSHKQARRLTKRLGKRTISGWKLGNIINKPEWSDAEKVGIDGWSEKGIENYGSATVKNVKLLFNPNVTTLCDIDDDGKTGLAEAIYALQIVAGYE